MYLTGHLWPVSLFPDETAIEANDLPELIPRVGGSVEITGASAAIRNSFE